MAIYLDNAATSYPKPDAVADSVYRFMKEVGSSAGRGSYAKAREAGRIVADARVLLCRLFNHTNPEQVVFTANVTEAINLAIRGIVTKGGHVITSGVEHNAVWRCLKMLERDRGIQISVAPCDCTGRTDAAAIEALIQPQTELMVFTHASNVLGTLQPIRRIGAITREKGIPLLVDSAQTAGCYPIDMQMDGIDLLAFTGHKSLLGPMGTGGLVVNSPVVIRPQKAGGTGRDSVNPYQPDYYPDRLEAGTLNVSGIAGLGTAVGFILAEGVEVIRKHEVGLTAYALEKLQGLDRLTVYGTGAAEKTVGVVSFNILGIAAAEVAYVLDEVYGIMVRAGLHCAPAAHRLIGTEGEGTVRIGLGYFNQREDIDQLIAALSVICDKGR
ncbi:MAG TPA: aminotransferase class V-fold PLP-dependent enzyme [Patescibacteria group bacterium]|nr:aminotransferase class V-fold PLP-dependent enzyme [Patescibacteria group bacterium]